MSQPIYLDNAATTPIRSDVREAMLPYLTESFGNPSSSHSFGRTAQAGVDGARRKIAEALHAEPHHVIFTSGGTEADNLAILGAALAARANGRPFRVATSTAEHHAVLAAAEVVEQMGGESILLSVDSNGQIDLAQVDSALSDGLAVLSTMWVNNEVGIIQDVHSVAERCDAAGVPFHTDAVQAVGKVPCHFDELPCALMTISGHKIGAPKGVGALIVRNRRMVEALIHGGGQQYGVRPGTENVAGIVALGRAIELAVDEQEDNARAFAALRDDLERQLREIPTDTVVVGAEAPRAPHVSNVAFPGLDVQSMLMHLDLAGIACSSGSACNTGSAKPSHVLTALGVPQEVASSSIRFSFYKQNTAADVERVIEVLPDIVAKVRKLTEVLGE